MFIKKWSALFLTLLLSITGLFATGAGIQFGGFPSVKVSEEGIKSDAFDVNVTGTIRCTRIPLVFGSGITAGLSPENKAFGFSAFSDLWIIDTQIENIWNFYSGFGLSSVIKFSSENKTSLTLSPRFFAGMNWLFTDNFIEIYCQQNLEPSFVYYFNYKSESFNLYFPLEAGLRFHF